MSGYLLSFIYIQTQSTHHQKVWDINESVQHNNKINFAVLNAGFIAIVVYNYGAKFDIIAPDDGLFVEDCNTAYGFCHGVYFGHKNNSQLELLITILRAGPAIDGATQYCGDHGNIAKFGISCSPSESHISSLVCVNKCRCVIHWPLYFSTRRSSAHNGDQWQKLNQNRGLGVVLWWRIWMDKCVWRWPRLHWSTGFVQLYWVSILLIPGVSQPVGFSIPAKLKG